MPLADVSGGFLSDTARLTYFFRCDPTETGLFALASIASVGTLLARYEIWGRLRGNRIGL